MRQAASRLIRREDIARVRATLNQKINSVSFVAHQLIFLTLPCTHSLVNILSVCLTRRLRWCFFIMYNVACLAFTREILRCFKTVYFMQMLECQGEHVLPDPGL